MSSSDVTPVFGFDFVLYCSKIGQSSELEVNVGKLGESLLTRKIKSGPWSSRTVAEDRSMRKGS